VGQIRRIKRRENKEGTGMVCTTWTAQNRVKMAHWVVQLLIPFLSLGQTEFAAEVTKP
jgi:hypothetical protein